MVAGRTQSIDLTVRHVTKRCERVPQARVAMSDNPFQSVESESTTDLTVFVNVAVVIEVDKVVRVVFNWHAYEQSPRECEISGVIFGKLGTNQKIFDEGQKAVRDVFPPRHPAIERAAAENA